MTGPLADALNWAGISEDAFNEKLAKCNSEQERATLITNTLNKEYEAAAAEYNELTKSTQDARLATARMEEAQAATATIAYGSFITQVLDFLIVAIVIFFALKVLVKFKKPEAPAPEEAPTTKVCPFCKMEIPIEATRCGHCTSQLEG